jgi:hypothetical protein
LYGAMRAVVFVFLVETPETPYYRNSSHTLCLKAPLQAYKRSQGAHAPRDPACSNRLGVARERGYSRQVAVAQKGDRGRASHQYIVNLIYFFQETEQRKQRIVSVPLAFLLRHPNLHGH